MAKRRDWTEARAKVDDAEGRCRVCKSNRDGLDAAHVIPRSLAPVENQSAESIVPLCRRCHTAYDCHELDLLPYLTLDESVKAVEVAGTIANAYRIIKGTRP